MISDFPILVFVLSTAILLLTPGPTNTLLAAAGLERGSREALPLIAFAFAGYIFAISGWGIVLASVGNYYPWLNMVVRVVCSGYLLYIAVRIWRSAERPPISGSKTIGPATVFVTTILNPKGLLFASTIFPPEAFDNMQVYLISTALFACMVVPIGIVLVVFGAVVGSGRMIAMNPVKLQRTLAVVIGVFSATMVWTAIH
jgi:threonine/homoserine/homoserine lactone efflux protein